MAETTGTEICGLILSSCICYQPAGTDHDVHLCRCGGSWRAAADDTDEVVIVTFPGGIPGDDLPAAQARARALQASAISSGDIGLIAATMPPTRRGGIRYNTPADPG